MTTTAIFSPAELNVGDVVYKTDVWSGKQWPCEVIRVTKATLMVEDFETPRTFKRREDTFWNGDDYLMVAI